MHSNNEAIQGQKVSSLMCTDRLQWDLEVVSDVLIQRDINLVLSISLTENAKDTWHWRQEKLGHYSVNSAYLMMQEDKENNQTNSNSGFWRQLWNLKIPLKIKHLFGV